MNLEWPHFGHSMTLSSNNSEQKAHVFIESPLIKGRWIRLILHQISAMIAKNRGLTPLTMD
jgi:hypothetical protein